MCRERIAGRRGQVRYEGSTGRSHFQSSMVQNYVQDSLCFPSVACYSVSRFGDAIRRVSGDPVNFGSIALSAAARKAGKGQPPSARGEAQPGIVTVTRCGGDSRVRGSRRRIWSREGVTNSSFTKSPSPAGARQREKIRADSGGVSSGAWWPGILGDRSSMPDRLERLVSARRRSRACCPASPRLLLLACPMRPAPARRGCGPTYLSPRRGRYTVCVAPRPRMPCVIPGSGEDSFSSAVPIRGPPSPTCLPHIRAEHFAECRGGGKRRGNAGVPTSLPFIRQVGESRCSACLPSSICASRRRMLSRGSPSPPLAGEAFTYCLRG